MPFAEEVLLRLSALCSPLPESRLRPDAVPGQVGFGTNMYGKPTSMIGPCQEAKSPPDALGRSAGVRSLASSARRVGLAATVSIRG